MIPFILYDKNTVPGFYIDIGADEGIKRIAQKVVEDFNKVTGRNETVKILSDYSIKEGEKAVIFACKGKSHILDLLEKSGKIDCNGLNGKWEVYGNWIVDDSVLIIAGSDRRGTIYGMFDLSEKIGVTPLHFWGDAVILEKTKIEISIQNNMITNEPSVKYRGFFINDEWPCFGNWTFLHFGGFNAKMYDNVFELLLRLKGNYIWPAMWSSSFALDGPGSEAAELADIYGIVVGNSHHEPCLRASEEWDKVRGEDSIYGNAWSFKENREGLLKYWEDGLKRSSKWESLVTVGMRGERDSKVLGEDATLKDNIDLLKDIIHCQKDMIKNISDKELPMMLALYKEVEPYYYGDDSTEGLCEWNELEDVILMLCEDNYGYMRTLPDEKMRSHKAGFGMYYHLDYHGEPISYEWVNSTPLTKIWEQMSQAYDYGVRTVWIVNVGDLKFNEFPLTYFMNLAYDFENWGTKAPGREKEYTLNVLDKHFGGILTEAQLNEACWILSETVRLNGMRRPEALNPSVYHPCNYNEAKVMFKRADDLEQKTEEFLNMLKQNYKIELYEAAYSLFGFSALASANLLKMHLYAGLNELYARQGKKEANIIAHKIAEFIIMDRTLAKAMSEFKNSKWNGMERASHIGFTKWNEDGCRYPNRIYTEPFDRPRMCICRADDEKVYDKVYGKPMQLFADDFLYDNNRSSVEIQVFNAGIGAFEAAVEMPECKWLSCDRQNFTVEDVETVIFTCDKSLLGNERETAIVRITDKETIVEILFMAGKVDGAVGFDILPNHYSRKNEPDNVKIRELSDYGITGVGMKAYPDTKNFSHGNEPSLTYSLSLKKESEYTCEVWFAPTNPLTRDNKLEYGIFVNNEEPKYFNTVPNGYKSGDAIDSVWSEGVLTHRRICKSKIYLKEGINEVTILLSDAGLVLERILIYGEKEKPKPSYLGPMESIYKEI
jgi:hypothetical protein